MQRLAYGRFAGDFGRPPSVERALRQSLDSAMGTLDIADIAGFGTKLFVAPWWRSRVPILQFAAAA
jgi:hypothetical protein